MAYDFRVVVRSVYRSHQLSSPFHKFSRLIKYHFTKLAPFRLVLKGRIEFQGLHIGVNQERNFGFIYCIYNSPSYDIVFIL